MKGFFTSTAYPPAIGGAQNHIHSMALAFCENNHVNVASFWHENRTDWLLGTTFNLKNHASSYDYEGVHVDPLVLSIQQKAMSLPFILSFYLTKSSSVRQLALPLEVQLLNFAKESAFIHNARIGREPLTWASWSAAQKLDVPFILSPYHHPRWVGWNYRVYLDLYKKADALTALTESEKKTLISLGVSESKIHVVGVRPELAPSSDPFRFRRQYKIEGPLVLFLGQKFDYKGWRLLWNAMISVWKKSPQTHVAFIGPTTNSSKRFFEKISDPRVLELGIVDLQTKTDALAACDLLCVPSTQESFGIVYVEAWMNRKPVIGCRIPAVSEVISDGKDGFLVDASGPELADRICFLVSDTLAAKKMGEAGFEKAQKLHSPEAFNRRVKDFYNTVLNKKIFE